MIAVRDADPRRGEDGLHIVRLLLGKGADLGARNRQGETALFMARRYPALVRLLRGSDVNLRIGGRTPLGQAVNRSDKETVEVLL